MRVPTCITRNTVITEGIAIKTIRVTAIPMILRLIDSWIMVKYPSSTSPGVPVYPRGGGGDIHCRASTSGGQRGTRSRHRRTCDFADGPKTAKGAIIGSFALTR